MSLSPVTTNLVKPTFRAKQSGEPNVLPQNMNPADLQVQPAAYMKPFKPGFIARVRAFFTNLAETTKGAVVGLFYGAAAGGAAAGVAAFMTKGGQAAASAVKSWPLLRNVFVASTIGGLAIGAVAGKQKASESIKGAGVGALYGAAAGVPAALTALALKSRGAGPVAKGVMIAATAVNAIIGAWVGKLIANGKVGKIYDQHGRANWSVKG
ncbi:MAG: hypothetical protein AB1782_09275 [Cyanobacteriota bacterium]